MKENLKQKINCVIVALGIGFGSLLHGCQPVIESKVTKQDLLNPARNKTRLYEAGPNQISDEAFHMYTNEYAGNFGFEDFESTASTVRKSSSENFSNLKYIASDGTTSYGIQAAADAWLDIDPLTGKQLGSFCTQEK